MCGRFSQTRSAAIVAEAFQLAEVPPLDPRYNIAPTQPVAVIRCTAEQPQRQLQQLRWGLIPSWAKDASIGSKLINARAETVAEKPSFRSAFSQRRCLVLADGFYEWQRLERGKQPFYIRVGEGEPFAFAGLWERWRGPDGEVESCTLLTTEPNELMRPIHDRMPVILQPQDYDLWLDPSVREPAQVQPLLHPYPAEAMTAYTVSKQVNSPANDSPECIKSA
ncbi:SOS response-associated peptidase [Leptolyngbya sp. FACHB-261]|uniref:SOS response-associated peptidase n=1 Tax=Leptolyngbya sp. FACHB-261 TaxID=2692806 RepID=UPI001686968E|nr:SOS response-associated peptidase [Leptolyngbya sp. FACHB-261]MBD2100164.1 SOS response-associated peptidase [Leptolyngbya sp. FACHB-261]